MVAVVACPTPILQFFDNAGKPAVGGSVLTQVGGVNAATYADSGGTTPLPNPIPLNSRGEVSDVNGISRQLFLVPNTVYTFTLSDAGGNQLNVATYVNGTQLTQSSIGAALYPPTNAENLAGATITNSAYPPLNPFRYGADGNGGANDTAAYNTVNSVIAKISTGIATWQNGQTIPGYPKSAQEITAAITLMNYSFPADGTGMLNVCRFMTEVQIADVLAGTALQDVSAAIQAANDYLEGRANNAIATLGAITGGTGYVNGSYINVNLTGGSGALASANITVSGGAVTSVALVDMGNGYTVGNTLSASNSQLGGAGSGFSIPVATLRPNGGGKTAMIGGKLFFPGGRYYCNMTGLRIGDMVEWIGNQFSSTRFSWNNAFNGNAVTIGPDKSGFNGRSGLYAMGSVLDNIMLELGNNTAWGIYTTGAQQNVTIRNLWINNACQNGFIFLQDHWGSTYIKVENVYCFPGSGTMGPSVVGIHCDGPACIELDRVSINGGSSNLIRGVEYVGGGLLITDFECERTVTHIDIAATAGESTVLIDSATMNLAIGGVQGVYIHSGWTGSIIARGLAVGPGQVAIRNDNTNEQVASSGGAGLVPLYVWSGTATDVSTIQNVISVPPVKTVTAASSGQTVTPDVSASQSFVYNVNENGGLTVAAPNMGANAMPASHIGHRIKITIRNVFGAAIGPTIWNAVFKMSAWTNPANANSRSIEFEWNGASWVQLWQATVDVPN